MERNVIVPVSHKYLYRHSFKAKSCQNILRREKLILTFVLHMDTEAANGAPEMCAFALALPLPKPHIKFPKIFYFQ